MTRRTLSSSLLSISGLWAARGMVLPPERRRYADPATEGEVIRLTDPAKCSWLPASARRCVSSRGNFLVYSSDRGQGNQVFRMDLKSGEARQLSEAKALDPASVLLSGDEKTVYFADGDTIQTATGREVFKAAGQLGPFSITEDGVAAVVADGGELVAVPALARGVKKKLADAAANEIHPRPRRASVVYRVEDQWWLAHLDGTVNRRLNALDGCVGAQWSADGRVIFALQGRDLVEVDPDAGAKKTVARTSQFAAFHRNGDGSVFIGVSASKAQPHVLLLLRSTRREFTLCEHKSSPAGLGAPAFAPNSQRIFYQSDRDGNPAIYMVSVDKLVEKTEAS